MVVLLLLWLGCAESRLPAEPPPGSLVHAPAPPIPDGALRRFGVSGWGEAIAEVGAPSKRQGVVRSGGGLAEEDERAKRSRAVGLEGGRWALARRTRPSLSEVWEIWDPAVGLVAAVAAPRDGRWLPTPDGAWLVAEGRPSIRLDATVSPSPRRARVARGHEIVWSASAARLLDAPWVSAAPEGCTSPTTSPDGAWTACRDETSVVLVRDREVVARWADVPEGELVVAPGGVRVGLLAPSGEVAAWTPATGARWARGDLVDRAEAWALAWTGDGGLLVGAREDVGTFVLDGASGARLDAPAAPVRAIADLAVRPDGWVATRDEDHAVRVWTPDGALVAEGRGSFGANLRWDGDHLLQVTPGRASAWALPAGGGPVSPLAPVAEPVGVDRGPLRWRLGHDEAGERVLLRDGEPWITWPSADRAPSQLLVLSPSERWATTGRMGELLDLEARAIVAVPWARWPMAPDDTGRVWSAEGTGVVARRPGRASPVASWDAGAQVTAVAVGPDAVYAGHADGTVTVWPLPPDAPEPASSAPRARSPLAVDAIVLPSGAAVVAVSDDGRRIATRAADSEAVVVYELPSGRELARVAEPRDGLAFEPDGTLIVGEPGLGWRVSPDGVVTPDAPPRWSDGEGWRWDDGGLALVDEREWIRADAEGTRGEVLGPAEAVGVRGGAQLVWRGPGLWSERAPLGVDFTWPILPHDTVRVVADVGRRRLATGPGEAWVAADGRWKPLKLRRPAWLPAAERGFAWDAGFEAAQWTWLDDDTVLGAGTGWLAAWSGAGARPDWMRPSWATPDALAVSEDGQALAWTFEASRVRPGPDTLVVTGLDPDDIRCVMDIPRGAVALSPDGRRGLVVGAAVPPRSLDVARCELGGVEPPPRERLASTPAGLGRSIAERTEHGTLGFDPRADAVVLWRADTGEVLANAPIGGAQPQIVASAGAGDRFLLLRREPDPSSIWRTAPLAEVEPLPVGTLPASTGVAVSGDGTLAVELRSGGVWIRPPGGPARWLWPETAGITRVAFSPEGGHLLVWARRELHILRVSAALAKAVVFEGTVATR